MWLKKLTSHLLNIIKFFFQQFQPPSHFLIEIFCYIFGIQTSNIAISIACIGHMIILWEKFHEKNFFSFFFQPLGADSERKKDFTYRSSNRNAQIGGIQHTSPIFSPDQSDLILLSPDAQLRPFNSTFSGQLFNTLFFSEISFVWPIYSNK